MLSAITFKNNHQKKQKKTKTKTILLTIHIYESYKT